MTTKLSESLRDLRNGLFPDIETVNTVLDQCVAQAEAQEAKAGEWTDGDVEAAYLMGALNASAHEPTGETHWPSMDRVKAELDRIKANRWKIADMVRQVRGKASSKPSQAIGEPVALNNDQIEQVSSWWQRRGGHDRLARAHFEAGMREVLAHRSPMSSEARDLAIEALDNAKRNASGCTCDEAYKSRGMAGPSCAACDFHEVMQFVDQALSALRGE